jgi:hypothetical protein
VGTKVKGASLLARLEYMDDFERAIELIGGREATVELGRCRDRGDALCEFHCRWS